MNHGWKPNAQSIRGDYILLPVFGQILMPRSSHAVDSVASREHALDERLDRLHEVTLVVAMDSISD